MTALEDDLTVSLSNPCQYSLNGTDWNELQVGEQTPAINTGDMISFKATGLVPNSSNGIGTFTVNKKFNLKGNVMSMLFGDEGKNSFDLTGCDYAFYKLFYNCSTLQSVSKDFLPATTLAKDCYSGMFNGCTSLTKAPKLPATALDNYCYEAMFNGCTSLTKAPELPATTLATYCYLSMFEGCTSLTQAPELPATTLATYCYQYMFQNCTSLTTAPSILPATTLTSNCYEAMFKNCTSLTKAPELPATTLATYCYRSMFNGCTSLNYIKALFTTAPKLTYTSNWVNGVSSKGTFVKSKDATWNVTGVGGIPEGWTVETA